MAEESVVHVLATHLMGGKESEHHPACHSLSHLSLPTPQFTGQGMGTSREGPASLLPEPGTPTPETRT